jgi:hypothetical protein
VAKRTARAATGTGEGSAATLLLGDARETLAALPEESVHCCVTSPPYFRLRSYGYGIFLVIAGVVYIRSGMLQVNPTLYLLGWRVMEVTVGERWVGYALGRRSLRSDELINVRRVTDRVFIASRSEERDAA